MSRSKRAKSNADSAAKRSPKLQSTDGVEVEVPGTPAPDPEALAVPGAGKQLLQADTWGTMVFAVAAALGAAAKALVPLAAVVAVVLFVAGMAAYVVAYARAVQRSRTDAITLAGLFFGVGCAPRLVNRHLRRTLAAQCVIGLAGAASRPFTAMATMVLAPMFGLGILGLWCARHGVFGPREVDPRRKAREVSADQPE